MKNRSYIGITGFTSPLEVSSILEGIDFQKSNRMLMVGVLVNSKSLEGGTSSRYPLIEKVKTIFPDNENCMNLVHFNNNRGHESLLSQLKSITDIAGDHFDGFQLNITWPSAKVLEHYKRAYNKKVVLQVSNGAFNTVSNSPKKLAEKIHDEYNGLVDHFLLDASGGTGKLFNSEIMRSYLEVLSSKTHTYGLGVAGGLSPSTLHLLEPLVKDFPEINIDAEGRLRNNEDNLDIEITGRYLEKSLELFS